MSVSKDLPIDEPYNPILMSEVFTRDGEMDLPNEDKFLIHFYTETSDVQIWFNSDTNEPPLHLYKGGRWNLRSYNKVFKNIKFKFLRESPEVEPKLFVIVEDLLR